jgi:hypothetical protein
MATQQVVLYLPSVSRRQQLMVPEEARKVVPEGSRTAAS